MDSHSPTGTLSTPTQNRPSFKEIFSTLKNYVPQLRRQSLHERLDRLKRLEALVLEARPLLKKALASDFGKPPTETDLSEILPVLLEIEHARENLEKWATPKKVPTPLRLVGTTSEIRFEPKGTILILGPWNYPFSLVLNPLVACLAAGNNALIKPSELCPSNAELLEKLISKYFKPYEVACVWGDSKTAQELLALPFDHIFFTGSTRVGQLVMGAAAKNLTPVTLELGGKSPCIIGNDFPIKTAAQRILWAKFINAGQTCVAPDFVCVPSHHLPDFLMEAQETLKNLFGPTAEARKSSPDFARVINKFHFERLSNLLDSALASGADLVFGDTSDPKTRFFPPTLLKMNSFSNPVFEEEIFGPLLPIIAYDDSEKLVESLRAFPNPLALYVFSKNDNFKNQILTGLPSGGVCINHALLHLMNPHLPFGGVGPSGLGSYHGRAGFLALSHSRSVLTQNPWIPSLVDQVRPPYNKKSTDLITELNIKIGPGFRRRDSGISGAPE